MPRPKPQYVHDFLLAMLRRGPQPVSYIRTEAEYSLIPQRTLTRAADDLGIERTRDGKQVFWRLPGSIVPSLSLALANGPVAVSSLGYTDDELEQAIEKLTTRVDLLRRHRRKRLKKRRARQMRSPDFVAHRAGPRFYRDKHGDEYLVGMSFTDAQVIIDLLRHTALPRKELYLQAEKRGVSRRRADRAASMLNIPRTKTHWGPC